MAQQRKILFIDAYDSFSESIAALLRQLLNTHVRIIQTDTELDQIFQPITPDFGSYLQTFDAIVLGPGPGDPRQRLDTGLFQDIWELAAPRKIPVLGICLGFQSLCLRYGAEISSLPLPCHGHTKDIYHTGSDIFDGVGKVIATNYNSLGVRVWSATGSQSQISTRSSSTSSWESDTTSNSAVLGGHDFSGLQPNIEAFGKDVDLQPLAWDNLGWLMSVRHVELPFWGLQFHPESCKSNIACHVVLKNWWTAVRQSNDNLRAQVLHHSTSPNTINSPLEVEFPSRGQTLPDSGVGSFREGLQSLASSSGPILQAQVIIKSITNESIGNYCHQASIKGSTAMLESTKKGRFSIYAIPSSSTWRLEQVEGKCTLSTAHSGPCTWKISNDNLLREVEILISAKRASGGPENIPFWGGFVGYLSYELGLQTIDVPTEKAYGHRIPEVSLMWVERSIVIDNLEGVIHVQSIRSDDSVWVEETRRNITDLEQTMENRGSVHVPYETTSASARITLPDEEAYKSQIRTCMSHLKAGNSYELCLTASATISLPRLSDGSNYTLYSHLRKHNPVPYSAFLSLGGTTLLSSSPEQFLKWSRCTGTVSMMPMKGTVSKLSPGMTYTKACQILASPKEAAENLMIVDLIRHDLYSALGYDAEVQVKKLCEVIEHETVYQSVSHIEASPPIVAHVSEEAKKTSIIHYGHQALRSSLPPGSMTGAPKKRSCEILRDLERRDRGVYSGVVGYFDVGGGGGWSVAIRGAVNYEDAQICGALEGEADVQRNVQQTWHVGAGGAITVLSDVDAEWEEMKVKMESVLRAFRSVEGGVR